MIGDLSLHAVVTVTPESDLNMLTFVNPLGIVPKLVRIRSGDHPAGGMFDFAAIPEFGVGGYIYQGSDASQPWNMVSEEPSSPRQFRTTESAIEIQRGAAASGKWKTGITYTIHIYA